MALIKYYEGATVKIVGDAHLGRRFMNGVPMSRRGERERMIWGQFHSEMAPEGADLVVCVGDIFDKAIVPYHVIMNTEAIIREHAEANPNTIFVVLAGNHDLSKDTEKVSAFLVLKGLLRDLRNVHILDEAMSCGAGSEWFVFLPYSVTDTAENVVKSLLEGPSPLGYEKYTAAFGHWDTTSYGGENIMPHNVLSSLAHEAYTGHIHLPGLILESESYRAEKVGSMQPYAHGEEINEDLYVTRELSQLDGSEDFTSKCLRVVLRKGEDIPYDIPCLMLTIKRVDDQGEEVESLEVNFDTFSMDGLFRESMTEFQVSERIAEKISERFIEMRGEG